MIVYTGIDPVTGQQRQISRQVSGSRKQAERVETRLKGEVLAGRHRGTAAKTLGEMVDVYLEWREQNHKPIGPRTIQGYRALAEARIKPGLGKLRLPQADPRRWIASTAHCAGVGVCAGRGSRCRAAGSVTCTP